MKPTLDELRKVREWVNVSKIFNMDYTWGYTSALIDVVDLLERDYIKRMFTTLSVPRNQNNLIKFFKFLLYHKEYLRDRGRDFLIGYDGERKEFYIK